MSRIWPLAALLMILALSKPVGAVPTYANDQPQITSGYFRFVSIGQARGSIKPRPSVTLEPLGGGRPTVLIVPSVDNTTAEPDPGIMSTVNGLKAGDIVEVEMSRFNGMPSIHTIKQITVKPGEDTPHGFIFAGRDPDDKPVVHFTKYGQELEMAIPMVRGEKGKSEPDPQMLAAIDQLKDGDVVYVQFAMQGRVPQVQSIFPYKEPDSGKLAKITTQDHEGQKAPAVEIEGDDGKTVTALISGKLVNKRWVADQQLVRQVHAIRPGTAVQYLTRQDGDKTILVDIGKAPPAPKLEATTPDKPKKK